uniref:EF-hand domain-containing protein n=1 Tax=Gossypium raimondii TaxID=29730 RepID=A0A0D2RIN1_GOSRA|nr:hypothetical protein B456_005G102500 [Gossypium raimondii]
MNYRNCSKKSKCTRKCFPVPLTKPQVKRILESFDRNGDGRLSKQELKSALYYMGSYVPSWRAAQAHIEGEMDDLVEYVWQCVYTVS